MNVKRMASIVLGILMVGVLSACGRTKESNAEQIAEYLEAYLEGNCFTMEEDGNTTEYVDYEATEKLYELYSAAKDEESAKILERFTKVKDQLVAIEKSTMAEKEIIYTECDDSGKVVKSFNSNDMSMYYTYTYDENGHLVEKSQFSIDGGEAIVTLTYEYDEYGNCVKSINEKGRKSTYKYTYDENGRILTGPKVDISVDGEVTADAIQFTYEYNDKGQVVKLSGKQTNGKDVIYELVYDETGKLTKSTNVMYEGNVIEEFSYDGERLSRITKSSSASSENYTYNYGIRYCFDVEGLE